jgi:hypothetical protein
MGIGYFENNIKTFFTKSFFPEINSFQNVKHIIRTFFACNLFKFLLISQHARQTLSAVAE